MVRKLLFVRTAVRRLFILDGLQLFCIVEIALKINREWCLDGLAIEVVVRPMSSRSLRAALAGCLQVRAPRNIEDDKNQYIPPGALPFGLHPHCN